MTESRARGRARPLVACLFYSIAVLSAATAHAQTVDDGIMLPKGTLFVGQIYTHDDWTEYWEGALKRTNGNIGTLTTRSNHWFGNYALTDRLNVLASVPYVWTRASQGVLHGMNGVQDLMLAGKYSFWEMPSSPMGSIKVIGVLSGGLPLTDYTPDFLPLSIGSASKRVTARATFNVQTAPGWFVNATTAYTWRAHVTLDRPYYYTMGQLFFTDEVSMPRVADLALSSGYNKHGLMAQAMLSVQRTRGGGDIRRQDMPFVSNRMNASRAGGLVMYEIPRLGGLAALFSYAHTFDGRNVGQSTSMSTGLMYRLRLFSRVTP
jgi:hypothetical protein